MVRISSTVLLILLTFTSRSSSNTFLVDEIKAAYIYNFLILSKWPDDKRSENDSLIQITVIGNEYSFFNILAKIQNEKISGKPLAINQFTRLVTRSELKKSYMLYISTSESRHLSQILKKTEDLCVLTVSGISQFVERGGMIQFVYVNENVRFKINKKAIDKSGIWMPSQVYQLAVEIIK